MDKTQVRDMRMKQLLPTLGVVALVLVLTLTAVAYAQSPIISGSNSSSLLVNIQVNVTAQQAVLPNQVAVNVLVTPINTTAINATFIAYRVSNGQPIPVTFNVSLGIINNTGAYLVRSLGSYTVGGYFTMIINNANGYNALLYQVTINGTTYPGSNTWFFTTFQLPIIQSPFITTLTVFLGLAIFIALAGRHNLRTAGIGALIYGSFVYGLLQLIGLSTPQLVAMAVMSWVIGIVFIIYANKLER
jgi:hypothetical protein